MNSIHTPITRRSLLAGSTLFPAILRGERRKSNVIVLFSDDQRFDTIHALGNREIHTPNLDRLTRSGVSFTHAHIMGGTAPAVCVASRAMLLSGQTLFRADERLTAEVTGRGRKGPFALLPQHFRENGYTTFGTGKWHNRPPLYARCFDAGENILFGGMSDHWRVPIHNFRSAGIYPAEPDRFGDKHSSELFSDAAIRFLEGYSSQKPFFMYVAYSAPHDPRQPPEAFRKMYPPDRISVPSNFLPTHPFDNGELRIRDEMLAPFPRRAPIIRQHLADYYAMISHMDAQIGRVLDTLKRTGRHKDTIVVFASDNGLALGQHGLMGKQSLYDHSVRVPMILSGPGIVRNRRSPSTCYLLDLFPTLCDLCELPVPASVEGKSFEPILRNRPVDARDSLFFAYRDLQRGVKKGDWKLIRYKTQSPVRAQLFHLRDDPHEMRNLAVVAGHEDRVAELDRELDEWMRKTGDPLGGITNLMS